MYEELLHGRPPDPDLLRRRGDPNRSVAGGPNAGIEHLPVGLYEVSYLLIEYGLVAGKLEALNREAGEHTLAGIERVGNGLRALHPTFFNRCKTACAAFG